MTGLADRAPVAPGRAEQGGCGCGALVVVILCGAVGNLWGRVGRLEGRLEAALQREAWASAEWRRLGTLLPPGWRVVESPAAWARSAGVDPGPGAL